MKRNSPLVSVTCVCEPVLPVSVTVTPGSTPPCSSVTLPVMVPVSVCAPAAVARATMPTRRASTKIRFIVVPPCLLQSRRDCAVDAVVARGVDRVASASRERQDHRDPGTSFEEGFRLERRLVRCRLLLLGQGRALGGDLFHDGRNRGL